MAKKSVRAEEREPEEVDGEQEDAAVGEDSSELESALVKMVRMQYGVLAGGARGVTEMAKMMETFIDSLAKETKLKSSEDWRDMLESTPDAMVRASRKAMDKGDMAAQAMVDTYRSYSEGRE